MWQGRLKQLWAAKTVLSVDSLNHLYYKWMKKVLGKFDKYVLDEESSRGCLRRRYWRVRKAWRLTKTRPATLLSICWSSSAGKCQGGILSSSCPCQIQPKMPR